MALHLSSPTTSENSLFSSKISVYFVIPIFRIFSKLIPFLLIETYEMVIPRTFHKENFKKYTVINTINIFSRCSILKILVLNTVSHRWKPRLYVSRAVLKSPHNAKDHYQIQEKFHEFFHKVSIQYLVHRR